jgi:hypothetical protein
MGRRILFARGTLSTASCTTQAEVLVGWGSFAWRTRLPAPYRPRVKISSRVGGAMPGDSLSHYPGRPPLRSE